MSHVTSWRGDGNSDRLCRTCRRQRPWRRWDASRRPLDTGSETHVDTTALTRAVQHNTTHGRFDKPPSPSVCPCRALAWLAQQRSGRSRPPALLRCWISQASARSVRVGNRQTNKRTKRQTEGHRGGAEQCVVGVLVVCRSKKDPVR